MSVVRRSFQSGLSDADLYDRRGGMDALDAAFVAKHHYRGASSQHIARMLNRSVPDVQSIRDLLDEPQHLSELVEEVRRLQDRLATMNEVAQACALPKVELVPREAVIAPPPLAPSAPSIADIAKEVADYYRVSLAEMRGPERCQSIAVPRQAAYFACRQVRGADGQPKYSWSQIAHYFGDRDHTTVLTGCRRHADRLAAAQPEKAAA